MEFIKEKQTIIKADLEEQPDLMLNPQDEVTEIMGNPPTWTMRWGIFLITIITISGLTMSAFVNYPDIIEAPVYLTTENPPLEIFSKMEGKIDQLLVDDQQYVGKHTLLATIKNPANHKDVIQMNNFIDQLEKKVGKWRQFRKLSIPGELELGVLNGTYSELVQGTRDLQYYLKRHAVFAQMASMEREIEQIEKLNISLEKQEQMFQNLSLIHISEPTRPY